MTAVTAPARLKTICAWCGRILKEGPADPVSHGICPECRAKIWTEFLAGKGGGKAER